MDDTRQLELGIDTEYDKVVHYLEALLLQIKNKEIEVMELGLTVDVHKVSIDGYTVDMRCSSVVRHTIVVRIN